VSLFFSFLFFLSFYILHVHVRAPYHPYGAPHYPDPYQRPPQGVGREEVLIVSDDRVLSLQPRGLNRSQSQRYMADNMSMVSMTIPR